MFSPAMAHLRPVPVTPVSTALFRRVVHDDRYRLLSASIIRTRERLHGRVVWNINSSASVGGVAAMLRSLVAYAAGAGIDARWLVIDGDPELFRIGKRIDNHLHGFDWDGGTLSERDHEEYQRRLAPVALELARLVRGGDIVLLHGPHTAGLVPELKQTGATVIWRGSSGRAVTDGCASDAWTFLMRYLSDADGFVFSRHIAVPADLPVERVHIISPSLDPMAPKNQPMTRSEAAAILINADLMYGYSPSPPLYIHPSGTINMVSRRAELVQLEQITPRTRLVVQVSRWDRLKDPIGVMHGFAALVSPKTDSHLLLAGPEVTAVADDPDATDVLNRTIAAWEGLPEHARRRVHLAMLPTRDVDENAAVVNALQRWAMVVVQKSLAEGLGLAVAEAMWKGRPVVTARGGMVDDQIEDGRSGLLLDDPTDLAEFASKVMRLLEQPELASAMGCAARHLIGESHLADRHLIQYGDLLSRV